MDSRTAAAIPIGTTVMMERTGETME